LEVRVASRTGLCVDVGIRSPAGTEEDVALAMPMTLGWSLERYH